MKLNYLICTYYIIHHHFSTLSVNPPRPGAASALKCTPTPEELLRLQFIILCLK